MYDIYQWEAHGNSQYVSDATLAQKISYYEDYQKKFDVTMPGLIDDDDQSWAKLYETYCPEDNKKREYTAIYAIDFDGIVAFKSAWISPGVWSNGGMKPYPLLDAALEELLANTGIDFDQIENVKNQNVSCFSTNGAVYLQLPRFLHYSLGIYNLDGKCIVTRTGSGSSVFNAGDKLSSGTYVIRLHAGKNKYTSPFIINK